jgi:homocysteine S-methyltransferase
VPAAILDRMRQADTPAAARAEGIRIAQEILEKIKGMVQGIQIRGPFQEYETAIEVLSVIGTLKSI